MIAITQLLLVAAVIIALRLVSEILQSIPALPPSNQVPVFVADTVHVAGINPPQINQLKSLLSAQDCTSLTQFLLFTRPRLLEIEKYVDEVVIKRMRDYQLALQRGQTRKQDHLFLPEQPELFDFSELTMKDLEHLCTYAPHWSTPFNLAVFDVFGGIRRFLDNYRIYRNLYTGKPNTVLVPKNNEIRPHLEWLAKNFIVLQGQRIPLEHRLRVLNLSQLNNMARELKQNLSFQNEQQAIEHLSKVPGAAILLAMIYTINDMFYIDPQRLDVPMIDTMIAAYSACAKLLCTASQKSRKKVA
ncbi:MAG: hypothetical protein OEZ68_16480 [Gammaproteobacteria bacterium]|nr:hypothetical protein [Gammaproteobacteria bacterium]MDH5802399.1 hypothetical protein [Gammaproteobacteria bacterium]